MPDLLYIDFEQFQLFFLDSLLFRVGKIEHLRLHTEAQRRRDKRERNAKDISDETIKNPLRLCGERSLSLGPPIRYTHRKYAIDTLNISYAYLIKFSEYLEILI